MTAKQRESESNTWECKNTLEKITDKINCLEGQRDITVNRALALHATNLCLISGTTYNPSKLSEMIPVYRARSMSHGMWPLKNLLQ